MVIDKTKEFTTSEELKKLVEISLAETNIYSQIVEINNQEDSGKISERESRQKQIELTTKWNALAQDKNRIYNAVESRYVASLDTIEKALQDAIEIITAYTAEDYSEKYTVQRNVALEMAQDFKDEKTRKEYIDNATENLYSWDRKGILIGLKLLVILPTRAIALKSDKVTHTGDTDYLADDPAYKEIENRIEARATEIWDELVECYGGEELPPFNLQLFGETPHRPIIRTVKPQNYIAPVDLATSRTFRHNGNRQEYLEQANGQLIFKETLEVIKKGKSRSPVTTVWNIAYDGAEFSKPLDQYDRTVFNTVISHIKAGNKSFTLGMLYKTLTGKDATRDSNLTDLKRSIEKLSTTKVTLDYTEEVGKTIGEAFTDKKGGRYYIKSYVLPLMEAIENLNGVETSAYNAISKPPLLQYAEAKKQLACVPIEVLNIPVNSSRDNLAIREYLIQRIKAMEHSSKISNDILIDSIIEVIQEGKKARIRKDRTVNTAERILEYWVNIGFIKSYKKKVDRFSIERNKPKG